MSDSILITGGTGSLGTALVQAFLPLETAKRIVVFSRDEVKQGTMAESLVGRDPYDKVRFFLGDVRDAGRLQEALEGIDIVIHAAALKRVDQVSYNPSEVLKTNVLGTLNVLQAALAQDVGKVLFISSDKAIHPINVYGATKLLGEFLTIRSNTLSAPRGLFASVLRYGNVWGSRGSVMERFAQQQARGERITVTDPGMTRFLVTLLRAVQFVQNALNLMQGGEVFVPQLAAWRLSQVASLFQAPPWEVTGLRPGGEKRHEQLIADSEEHRVVKCAPFYVVLPELTEWTRQYGWRNATLHPISTYRSDRVLRVSDTELESLL